MQSAGWPLPALALALAALALVACAGPPAASLPPAASSSSEAADPLSADALMRHVSVLVDPALAGRAAGSEGERQAAEYVRSELARTGLAPQTQPFRTWSGDESANVFATIEGRRRDELIVIGAHLDHLGVRDGALYAGAEDDASGVAVVLGIAKALAARRGELDRSVIVVFFGAEELSMQGSWAFVGHPPVPLARVRAMVNVDMIGRRLVDQKWMWLLERPLGVDDRRAVGVVGARRYPGLRALLDEACAAERVEPFAAEDLPSPVDEEIERQAEGRGDSVPFERLGVPALFFGSGESSDYHASTDTLDKLEPTVMARRARAILRVTIALSAAPENAFRAAPPEAPPPPKRLPSGTFLPIGVATGYSSYGRGAFVGVEASLVHAWPSLFWLGGYADALYDFGRGHARATIGPEIGAGFFGLDGGLLLERVDGQLRKGLVVRSMITASWVAITFRSGYVLDKREVFEEVGVLIKIPTGL
jgi:hypothetical protein